MSSLRGRRAPITATREETRAFVERLGRSFDEARRVIKRGQLGLYPNNMLVLPRPFNEHRGEK